MPALSPTRRDDDGYRAVAPINRPGLLGHRRQVNLERALVACSTPTKTTATMICLSLRWAQT